MNDLYFVHRSYLVCGNARRKDTEIGDFMP